MATATRKTTTARTAAPAEQAPPPNDQVQATGPTSEPAGEVTSELLQLDPATLLIEGNIRRRAELDEDFIASVREHGVLVPIVAVRTEQGIQVRYGQRRTLAACQAQRPSVPVVVFSAAPGAELDRIVQQWHENEKRRSLGTSDQAAAAQQLAAFGLSAEQISARLGAAKPHVEQALKVGRSELATKAADRYDLTIDQAAVLAEFDTDKDVLTMLIAAAKEGPGRFAHAAQAARDARELAEKVAAATAKLTKAKVRILTPDQRRGATPLTDLTADKDRKPITPAQHKRCPGHAAYVTEHWRGVETVYVCTDWIKNGHHNRWGTWQDKPVPAQMSTEEADALTEQQRQQRRTVIANNKAWASAETVRREWVRSVLTSRTIKGAAGFVAAELAHGDHALRRAMETTGLLPELLGCKGRLDLAATAEQATDSRAQVIGLGIILAALEGSITRDAWRSPQPAHKRYLRFLASIGYQLSDVEQLVLGKPKTTRRTSTKATGGPAGEITHQDAPDPAGPAEADPAAPTPDAA